VSPRKKEDLTVLLFKDHYPARSFRVPFAWLRRFGIVLGVGLLITLGSLFLAARFYRQLMVYDPSRVQELKKQLSEYQSAYEEIRQAPEFAQSDEESPIQVDAVLSGFPPFSALPAEYQKVVPKSLSTVELRNIEVSVKKNKVGLRFWIFNRRKSGGSQKGRIILFARGPETLMAYPSGVLNPVGAASLASPSRGEFFAINRFRETFAEFPLPHAYPEDYLREFEILLLGENNEILLSRKVPFSLKKGSP